MADTLFVGALPMPFLRCQFPKIQQGARVHPFAFRSLLQTYEVLDGTSYLLHIVYIGLTNPRHGNNTTRSFRFIVPHGGIRFTNHYRWLKLVFDESWLDSASYLPFTRHGDPSLRDPHGYLLLIREGYLLLLPRFSPFSIIKQTFPTHQPFFKASNLQHTAPKQQAQQIP